MERITEKDYENILELCLALNNHVDGYRLEVLKNISRLLGPGFNNLTFLEISNGGKLGNPVAINQVKSLCEIYDNKYNKYDFFLDKLMDSTYSNKVWDIEDVMSKNEYELTTYYNDFLKKMNIYYELAIPLNYKNKLVGGLGIFREKKDGEFSLREKNIANIISQHLSLSYYNWLNVKSLKSNKSKSYELDDCYLTCLTKSEQKVAQLVECGMTNREIANKNNVSFYTVKSHLEHIYVKLDVHNRTEMIHKIKELRNN